MVDNQSIARRVGVALGFVAPAEVRSNELPIMGSPYMPVNARNLEGLNTHTAVSTDRALGLAGVYRSVSILSTSVAQMGVGVWRNGEEIPLKTTDLIARPNIDMSRMAFLEQTVVSMALNGNAYWLLGRDSHSPTATVRNITVLNPANVVVDYKNGKKVYLYGEKTYAAWQVKHLWFMRVPGYEYGIGPIQAAQNELRGALDLRNYSDNWFSTGGVPTGVLKTDQPLTPELAGEYRDRWNEQQAARQTAVLGQGLSYTPVYLNPADAQFIESSKFSLNQIARLFGIPAIYLMTDPGSSMTYQNAVHVDTAFVRYTLMKYLSEIEQALTDLLPRGQEARFKVEDLMRADQSTRFASYKTALDGKFMTVDEVRAKEGLLPLATPAVDTNEEGESV